MSSKAASLEWIRAFGRWIGRAIGPGHAGDCELARMSDRELGDLGIGRSEIGHWQRSGTAGAGDRPGPVRPDDASGRR